MGYARTYELGVVWVASDTIIASNDTVKNAGETTLTLKKSIQVIKEVFPIGSLRVKVDLNAVIQPIEGWLYRNGVVVGLIGFNNIGGWINYSADFNFTDLKLNDSFELWTIQTAGGGVDQCRNFRLYADQGAFYNVLT